MFVFLFVFGGIAVGRSWMNLRAYEVCEGIHSQLVVWDIVVILDIGNSVVVVILIAASRAWPYLARGIEGSSWGEV